MNKILQHSLQSYPHECCGFLLGNEEPRARTVQEVMGCRNMADKPESHFLIAADDYRHAEAWADANKLALLGVYHSHPNGKAQPSPTDRQYALPFFSYLILAVGSREVTEMNAWLLEEDGFRKQQLITNTSIL